MNTTYTANAGGLSVSQGCAEVRSRAAALSGTRPNQYFAELLLRCWSAVQGLLKSRQAAKTRLRVCETALLGDKRFVAVVQVDQERFLIGGAANSVALLARLAEPQFVEPRFAEPVPFPSINMKEYSEGAQDV